MAKRNKRELREQLKSSLLLQHVSPYYREMSTILRALDTTEYVFDCCSEQDWETARLFFDGADSYLNTKNVTRIGHLASLANRLLDLVK